MSATSAPIHHALDDKVKQDAAFVDNESVSSTLDDDRLLQEIGYVPSFKREFSNLATVRALLPAPTASILPSGSGVIGCKVADQMDHVNRSASRSASWVSAPA